MMNIEDLATGLTMRNKGFQGGKKMTSKEALKELKDSFENDVYKVERSMLDIIDKDLQVLDILKKSIFNKEEHKYAMTEKFKGQKFMLVSLSIRGDDDIAKIKEWLENDL